MAYSTAEGIADALSLFDLIKGAIARNDELRAAQVAAGGNDAVDAELQMLAEFLPKAIQFSRSVRAHIKA